MFHELLFLIILHLSSQGEHMLRLRRVFSAPWSCVSNLRVLAYHMVTLLTWITKPYWACVTLVGLLASMDALMDNQVMIIKIYFLTDNILLKWLRCLTIITLQLCFGVNLHPAPVFWAPAFAHSDHVGP